MRLELLARLLRWLRESAGGGELPVASSLFREIEVAHRDLAEARSQLQSALEKFSQFLSVEEDHLLPLYRELRALLQESERRAGRVSAHIDEIERLSKALFAEWEEELKLYRNKTLRAKSRQKLQQTRKRCRSFLTAMRRAERQMAPVLDLFRDQVLFLKHHLNARAVSALRHELRLVERDVSGLIASMDRSIQEARLLLDQFVEPKALN